MWCKKSSPPGGHVFRRIKILQTVLEKGHPRNIPVQLFQNRTRGFREKTFLKISSCPYGAKSPPPPPQPMAAMFFDGSKFCEQFLKRVTHGTILSNYFKIWLVVSEEKNFEEFLWSPHSEKSLPPWRPCFLKDQNFANNFWKGLSKEQSREIISKSDMRFQRRILKNFSEVHTVKKASPHGGHVFQRIKIWQTIFEKSHTRNNLVKLFQILTSGFGEEDFLRISSYPYSAKSPLPPWRPCYSTDQNFANTFRKGSPKEQSCEIISKSDLQFQRRRIL